MELTIDEAKTGIVNTIVAGINKLLKDQLEGGDSRQHHNIIWRHISANVAQIEGINLGKQGQKKLCWWFN